MEAIAEAHSVGIVHRDLKPSNLFLARRKDGQTIKVLDFGISKTTGDGGPQGKGITSTNAVLGSPAYMSPEQLRNAKGIDARADVWSLGVIAYELLTGTLPFDGPNVVAIFAAIQETTPRPVSELRPEVPPVVAAAVHRCLERSRDARFASITELAQELAPFGSPSAAASLERIGKYVPAVRPASMSLPEIEGRAQTVLAPAGSSPSLPRPAGPAPTGTGTIGAVSSSRPAGLPGTGKRAAIVASAGVALVAGAVGAVFLLRAKLTEAPPAAAASLPPPAVTASAAPMPSVTLEPPPATSVAVLPPAPAASASAKARPAAPARPRAAAGGPAAPVSPKKPAKGAIPSDWN